MWPPIHTRYPRGCSVCNNNISSQDRRNLADKIRKEMIMWACRYGSNMHKISSARMEMRIWVIRLYDGNHNHAGPTYIHTYLFFLLPVVQEITSHDVWLSFLLVSLVISLGACQGRQRERRKMPAKMRAVCFSFSLLSHNRKDFFFSSAPLPIPYTLGAQLGRSPGSRMRV